MVVVVVVSYIVNAHKVDLISYKKLHNPSNKNYSHQPHRKFKFVSMCIPRGFADKGHELRQKSKVRTKLREIVIRGCNS